MPAAMVVFLSSFPAPSRVVDQGGRNATIADRRGARARSSATAPSGETTMKHYPLALAPAAASAPSLAPAEAQLSDRVCVVSDPTGIAQRARGTERSHRRRTIANVRLRAPAPQRAARAGPISTIPTWPAPSVTRSQFYWPEVPSPGRAEDDA